MVKNATSLTGNGLKDWLVQRVTAVILTVYSLFLWGFIIAHPQLSFAEWQSLFANPLMRWASLLSLISLILHTWVGIWTITTDYLKSTCVRATVQILVVLGLIGCLIWGIEILWGLSTWQ